jgi:hypothetical protein
MPRNTFTGGMIQDREDTFAPSNSYFVALNAVDQTDDSMGPFIANERSHKLETELPGDYKGQIYLEEINSSIIFSDDGSGSIYIFNHYDSELSRLVSDSEFGCNWGIVDCKMVKAEYKTHGKCNDLMLYFTAGCDYYVVNVSEMLDPVRKASAIACQDCAYFTIFDSVCSPRMTAIPIPFAGSTTQNGAVSFAVKLQDEDGNETNWFAASNTAYMYSENDIPGEPATNAVRLILNDLDLRYDRVTIAVIKNSSNVKVVEELDTIPYSGGKLSYDYYGQEGSIINPATVITPIKAFLRGEGLIQNDGRLYFYKLKNEKNLNYQLKANAITVEYVAYRVPIETQLKYSLPSFMRGETYDFGIVWNFCDGTSSPVYHIPACGVGGASTEEVKTQAQSLNLDTSFADFGPENFNTADRHKRPRNPENTGNESDNFENSVESNIDGIDTDFDSLVNAAACMDNEGNPVCCDDEGNAIITDVCDAAEAAIQADFQQYSNFVENQLEQIAQYGLDFPPEDIEVNQTTNLKDAAKYLFERAVRNREFITRKRPVFTFNQGGDALAAFSERVKNYVELDRDDPWAAIGDVEGNITKIDQGALRSVTSTIEYPDTKDCNGNRLYPSGGICHHQMPSVSDIPHFTSAINGVVNQYQPGNFEYGEASVILLGIAANGIQFPTEEELPKPLCPNNPYSIVHVKRSQSNKTVLAAGYLTGVFTGQVWGRTYAFPRHGVNSFEHVDRSIAAGEGGISRMGSQAPNSGLANFHSPDTDLMQPFLSATHFRTGLSLKGNGWRYGLHARGRDPIDANAGKRVDQRAARVANNLNHYDPAGDSDIPLLGVINAPANSVVTAPLGMSLSLMNKYRESSVFLETSSTVPGLGLDESFVGDVLIHTAPTRCTAPYGYLVREIPDQYGAIESRAYIKTGIEGRSGSTSCEGIAGDIFIGPYSKKRTSFVSNKVGNEFNVPNKDGSPCRARTICDSPDDKLFDLMGFSLNTTSLPEEGDLYDPKNYCGLHTVAGTCGDDGESRNPADAAAVGVSESDYYWPGVLNSLVHTFVESEVNAWHRGVDLSIPSGDIFYPKLRETNLDSAAPDPAPWEDSYMNEFHVPIEQPSRQQIAKGVLIRTLLNALFPAALLLNLSNLESVFDIVGTMFAASGVNALWTLMNHTLFTTDRIRTMLGFPSCLTDSEGGDLNTKAVGLKDNPKQYNPDYSVKSDLKTFYSPPRLFNTCDCDDCDKGDENGVGRQLNQEIYYSAKQNLDSDIDAYQNVRISSYNELPPNSGHLHNMFIQDNNLYAHTTKGLWAVQLSIGNLPADIGSQLTGEGELLARPILLLDSGTSEGFAGTRHGNSAINVPGWGYFFVDDQARKVYRFNGRPEEISAYGLSRFFRKHLPFCEDQACFDETEESRYVLGWDHNYSRLLLTKRDGDASFTASYTTKGSEQGGKWVSLHSYVPEAYFWDKNSIFSIADGSIYRNNQGEGYGDFYGINYPHFVQGTFNLPDNLKYFELNNIQIVTEVDSGPLKDLDNTFTSVAFFNPHASTGDRPTNLILPGSNTNSQRELSHNSLDEMTLYRRFGEWDISAPVNLLDQGCDRSVIIIEEDCSVIPTINDNITCKVLNQQDFRNRNFGGRYINFRFTFDNGEQLIKTFFVDWTANQPEHKVRS